MNPFFEIVVTNRATLKRISDSIAILQSEIATLEKDKTLNFQNGNLKIPAIRANIAARRPPGPARGIILSSGVPKNPGAAHMSFIGEINTRRTTVAKLKNVARHTAERFESDENIQNLALKFFPRGDDEIFCPVTLVEAIIGLEKIEHEALTVGKMSLEATSRLSVVPLDLVWTIRNFVAGAETKYVREPEPDKIFTATAT